MKEGRVIEEPAGPRQTGAQEVVQAIGTWGIGHGCGVMLPDAGDGGGFLIVPFRVQEASGEPMPGSQGPMVVAMDLNPSLRLLSRSLYPLLKRIDERTAISCLRAHETPVLTSFVGIRHFETDYEAFPAIACVPL